MNLAFVILYQFRQWLLDCSLLTPSLKPFWGSRGWYNKLMKQLDVVVSPPDFVWDPYMALTNVTFDPDPHDLRP